MFFITSNEGKFREVQEIARKYGIEIKWLKRSYLEPQGSELEEIAKKSAEILSKEVKEKFFIEDSGLFIEALNGFPGPYSSYVYRTIGNEGILKLMRGIRRRRAIFKSVVAYYDGIELLTFLGEVEGKISHRLKGESWGFDPIFEPKGFKGLTYGQLPPEVKNKISHRRKALEKLAAYLLRKHQNI